MKNRKKKNKKEKEKRKRKKKKKKGKEMYKAKIILEMHDWGNQCRSRGHTSKRFGDFLCQLSSGAKLSSLYWGKTVIIKLGQRVFTTILQ
ncbi:hypothetical protein NP118_23525 [Salmonella enterica]|nr:hypothetical protein [Salmonella enterica]